MKSATTLTINAWKKRSAYGASHRDTNISPEAAEPDPFVPSVYRIQRYVVICTTNWHRLGKQDCAGTLITVKAQGFPHLPVFTLPVIEVDSEAVIPSS